MMQFNRIFSILVVLLLFIGCEQDVPLSPQTQTSAELGGAVITEGGGGRAAVKTMTYNIYVGANVDRILEATDLIDLSQKVAAAYDTLFLTNFEERAQSIAKLIKRDKPHLIGLQEISLIQRFDPATFGLIEQQNYFQILMDALVSEGLNYQFADSIQNFDVLLPRFLDFIPPSTLVFDLVRLLDADVILVRDDVQYSNVIKGNYSVALPVPVPTTPPDTLDIFRGYVSINANVGQKSYRFINTHLESFVELIRLAQAQELTTIFSGETLPIIMVGDFNTGDPMPPNPYNDVTYQFLTMIAGYEDTWVYNLKGNQDEGFTSPFSAALQDPYPNLYQRLDLIFAKNFEGPIGPVQAEVIGIRFKDRTPSGLWPSDHAGVVAKLHLREMNNMTNSVITFAETPE